MMKILGMALIAFLLFTFQQWIYRRLWDRNLKVDVDFARPSLFEGEKGELLEVIENRKRLPLSMLKVKFQTDRNLVFGDTEGSRVTDQYYRNDVFQVGGGEKITRTLIFTGRKRGYYKINGIDLVAADLFMTSEMMDSRQTDRYVYVYPRPFDSREFTLSLQQLNGEILTRRHLVEDPFEYRGIREYQPYDDMRSVNWKATARTDELKVNHKNYTALQTIRIFFNTEDTGILKKEDAVEASLRITAGLARYYLAQGIRVACYGSGVDCIDGGPVEIEPGAGSGQMDRIYKALARVDTARPAVSFAGRFRGRLLQEAQGTMTFFVSPNAYEDFTDVIAEYVDSGQDCVWFFPVWEKEAPQVPEALGRYLRVIPIRK